MTALPPPHLFIPIPLPILLLCLFISRFVGAFFSPLMDCDETYNYWEPLYLLVSNLSHALQTWEYSPQFALRSYFFLTPWALIVTYLRSLFHISLRQSFFLLRLFLSLSSAFFELLLCRSLFKFDSIIHGSHFAYNSTRWFLLIISFSPGMFHSAPALLPSSFAMMGVTIFLTLWCRSLIARRGAFPRISPDIIYSLAIPSLTAWPYIAILGLPYAIPLLRRCPRSFLITCLIIAITILFPMTLFDSWLYKSLTVIPFNLIRYNVWYNQSYLYGIESPSFYFRNLALNWTILFPISLFTSVLYLLWGGAYISRDSGWSRGIACMMIIWLTVMSIQPHKEERFITPIYPVLAIMGYRGIQLIFDVIKRNPKYFMILTHTLSAIIVITGSLRIASLIMYYSAPLQIDLTAPEIIPIPSHPNIPVNVCTGNDWFLAPGHWHLPDYSRIKFVYQQFNGQLPGEYATHLLSGSNYSSISTVNWLSKLRHVTSAQGQSEFNDHNELTASRFIPLSSCHYLLGRDKMNVVNAEPIICAPMLDADQTPMWSRVLYHPWSKFGKQVWQEYCLWKISSP